MTKESAPDRTLLMIPGQQRMYVCVSWPQLFVITRVALMTGLGSGEGWGWEFCSNEYRYYIAVFSNTI